MSTRTELSAWSPEEVDSLENIDKEVQLVSTSSESHSVSSHTKENVPVNNVKIISDCNAGTETLGGQSSKSFIDFSSKSVNDLEASNCKLYSSCDDLSLWTRRNNLEFKPGNNQNADNPNTIYSSTPVTFKRNKKPSIHKYDHVQSKIKHYFNNNALKTEAPPQKPKNTVISDARDSSDKEEYLEEINKQLKKELDEKNAILSLLQENYEHLLFKYAEAQNRIDELRFKCLAETDSKNVGFQAKHKRIDNQISSHLLCSDKYLVKVPDVKCQKAVVAPFNKSEEPFHSPTNDLNVDAPANRPCSLPLDNNLKFPERDLIKATTPTDSEGLSSIITSMSGHSKILNSLDEENQVNKKSNLPKYQRSNFILEENCALNDPFDKVKNWQNSLPPLEQIETPETTLYNVSANNKRTYSSDGTKYKDISSPKTEKDYNFLDESCPSSWREDQHIEYCRNDSERSKSQISKISPRALSLPNTLRKRSVMSQFYKKKAHRSVDVSARESGQFQENRFGHSENNQPVKNDVPSGCIIQRRQKRPPLLRCSSLPTYDYDSIKLANCKNGIYIPPLDLGNVTLSDDESYCQQDYYFRKSNDCTSSSLVTSRGGSIDRSIQTPQSFSSCKATISEENSFSRVPRKTFNKSTSITPDRTKAMDSAFSSKYDRSKIDASRRKTPPSSCLKECSDRCSNRSKNWCTVCGEAISESRNGQFMRSNSCESVHNTDISSKQTSKQTRGPKPPFTRSVSFCSETNMPNYCSHEEEIPRSMFSGASRESFDNFDIYASNLKARSQAVIKALTAHVNNS